MPPDTHEITQLLQAWSEGDQNAAETLMPLVYDELHKLAHQHMRREKHGHMLQTTALVNEAFIRMIDQKQFRFENRGHFFALAARLMRRILVDDARQRNRAKRGGGNIQVSLNDNINVADQQAADVLALDEALKLLAQQDVRQSDIVELRFFGGLSIEETADVLKISVATVTRDWTFARAWLRNEMKAITDSN